MFSVFVPCCVVHCFCFLFIFAIILLGEIELVALFYLSSWCLAIVIFLSLFLTAPIVQVQVHAGGSDLRLFDGSH